MIMNNKLRLISILMLLLVGLGMKNYFSNKHDNLNVGSNSSEPITVLTVKPKVATVSREIETVGTLEPENEARVVNGTPGMLESTLVAAGISVKKGQALAKLKPDAVLRAPIKGVVQDWLVKDGNYLNVGTHLADLIDPSTLLVNYTLPEKIFSKLKVGQEIAITTKSIPNEEYKGEVIYVSPSADPMTHQINIRARVKNENGELIPGLFVKIEQILEEREKALLVPETVITKNIDESFLYTVRDGYIVKTQVVTGQRQNNGVEIISGITNLDDIVLVIPVGVRQIKQQVKTQEYGKTW